MGFLYICLWLFKYTKTSAVFFYFILTLSLEMSDDPYFCPYRTWLCMLPYARRVLPWAKETIGLSARL